VNVFIARLRPAEEVNWFRVENENWVDVYSEDGSPLEDAEYYDYDEHASGHDHRAEHMKSLLQISDVEDGAFLLNPEAVTPDGEWEAWFLANWIPGARRYPSFAHLMLDTYRGLDEEEPTGKDRFSMPEIPSPQVPRVPAERLPGGIAKSPTYESLIEQMRSNQPQIRKKAVRTFFGKSQLRRNGRRRPHLIKPLTDLFYLSEDPEVRSACISGLTEFAEDGAAPPPLLSSLSDPDPGVVLQGIFALHDFPNDKALEPLCRFVDARLNALFIENAMMALGEIGDCRAVPTLARVLMDDANTFTQNFATSAIALARCGPESFKVLVNAIDHKDARIRFAAVVGLDVSGDPRSSEYLDRAESDLDENVSRRAKIRMGKRQW
jgi:hypothetical protein